jgi:nucleotide-binding universal stress UspA family protein
MNSKMKILIAYDGSESANASLDELLRAGLPIEVETLIFVADVWLPSSSSALSRAFTSRRILASDLSSFAPARRAIEEERALSREAARRLQLLFPTWHVKAEASPGLGSPASEMLRKAVSWKADLVVIGSEVRATTAGFLSGGASRQVVAEAPCSVRIARPAAGLAVAPVRLIVCVGQHWARNAVRAITSREWPDGSECRIVVADESIGLIRVENSQTGGMTQAERIEEEPTRPSLMIQHAAEALRAAGLKVSTGIKKSQMHRALIEEAREWDADCIFVGTRGRDSKIDQCGLDSHAAFVVTNSPCSVEVARSATWVTDRAFIPTIRAALNLSEVGAG